MAPWLGVADWRPAGLEGRLVGANELPAAARRMNEIELVGSERERVVLGVEQREVGIHVAVEGQPLQAVLLNQVGSESEWVFVALFALRLVVKRALVVATVASNVQAWLSLLDQIEHDGVVEVIERKLQGGARHRELVG